MLGTGQVHVSEALGVRRGLLTGVGVHQLAGRHAVALAQARVGNVGDVAGLLTVGGGQTVLLLLVLRLRLTH